MGKGVCVWVGKGVTVLVGRTVNTELGSPATCAEVGVSVGGGGVAVGVADGRVAGMSAGKAVAGIVVGMRVVVGRGVAVSVGEGVNRTDGTLTEVSSLVGIGLSAGRRESSFSGDAPPSFSKAGILRSDSSV